MILSQDSSLPHTIQETENAEGEAAFTLEQSDRFAIQKNPFIEEGRFFGFHGIFQAADQEAV